jgi:hypothetical protein
MAYYMPSSFTGCKFIGGKDMNKRISIFIQVCCVALMLFSAAETATACELLGDGSFEGGSPNAYWAETGKPLCKNSKCGANYPRTGIWWAWFGGFIGAQYTGSLTQTVLISADSLPRLNFYLWNPGTSAKGVGVDFLKVTIDGEQIFIMLGGNPLYKSRYTLVDLDLTPYADGGCHTLSFQSTTVSATTVTNIFMDDVAIIHCPSIARIGATPYGSVQAAMAAAGDESEISATAQLFAENLLFSQTGRVTLKGGYDCGFFENIGYTTINGELTVSGSGTLITENIVIR